jgi:hypothetical protein
LRSDRGVRGTLVPRIFLTYFLPYFHTSPGDLGACFASVLTNFLTSSSLLTSILTYLLPSILTSLLTYLLPLGYPGSLLPSFPRGTLVIYFLTSLLTPLLPYFLTSLLPYFLPSLLPYFLTYLLPYLLTSLLTYLLPYFLTYLLPFLLPSSTDDTKYRSVLRGGGKASPHS